ncbi:hypothetical protein [Homoserinimonas hongtaonis]|uniref:hypothetical protein n=1 Tax=Homoserinimonas hongtaonis TaxID=2079791 RepID=UPI0018EEB788|nr:hypothetical protein [Salinibacterium hongtaonis]
MNLSVPRYVVIALGAVFSGYLLILAASSIDDGTGPARVAIAGLLFAAATIASLAVESKRAQFWIGLCNVALALILPMLVTSQLPADFVPGSSYATWYVAAVGALMVFTSARGFLLLSWVGIGILVVQSLLWGGFGELAPLGVFGSVLWVGVSHMLRSSLAKADRDAQVYIAAEREAAQWQAAQDAHLQERRFRLEQTGRMALPMLRHIVESDGALTEGERRECLLLEASIRDEIRGRSLLDDAVREQVMMARRRGATVNLLDEGGIDDLPAGDAAIVHSRIAHALQGCAADTIIVRTVAAGSEVAVTVVGLMASGVNLLGHSSDESDEPEIVLWLEIPRAEGNDGATDSPGRLSVSIGGEVGEGPEA